MLLLLVEYSRLRSSLLYSTVLTWLPKIYYSCAVGGWIKLSPALLEFGLSLATFGKISFLIRCLEVGEIIPVPD